MNLRSCAAVLSLLVLAACSAPASRESFHRSDGSGEYSFDVELADTAATYSFSFYTTVDSPPLLPDTLSSFPMRLLWRAPSGRSFSETVYYPAKSRKVCYRRGVTPAEPGLWTLYVSVVPEPPGLRGLGLIVSRD